MPTVKFTGKWSAEEQAAYEVPKGYLLVKYDQRYRKAIGEAFLKLDSYQKKKRAKVTEEKGTASPDDWQRELAVTIEFHYRKRTVDQNALMWALYEIEANEHNAGQLGHSNQMVKPMELYENDLYEWGEREIIETKRKNLAYYRDKYRVIKSVSVKGQEYSVDELLQIGMTDDERIKIKAIRSTSMLNTKEMARWIDGLFNRIAHNGLNVTEPAEIESYWQKWRQSLNDEKIQLHDEVMSQKAYKLINPICEACGKYIGERGDLAHIKAIGMGGDRTKSPEKNYASNWLHLCPECHRIVWHEDGVGEFLKLNPHLRYKVETALKRDYPAINEPEQIPIF